MGNYEEHDLKAYALRYFQHFSLKNINVLADMFADNVWLEDWENSASGKAEVLGVNQRIFDNTRSIVVSPGSLYQEGNTITAMLVIWVTNIEGDLDIIKVCDVIEFNHLAKISSITAYKG